MALIGFVGDLGSGKTLSLTYFAFRNWIKGREIFSNYTLDFNHTLIRTISNIESMREGFCALDEIWLWIDSRLSMTFKNRFLSLVLIKSRKRDLDIGYTSQHWMQVDCRVRNVTDFLAFPELTQNEKICRLRIVSYPYMTNTKTIVFRTEPFFEMYDHREEIEPLKFSKEEREQIKNIISK